MDSKFASYRESLKRERLKSTRQRDLIVGEFFRRHQHLTVEELLERVHRRDSSIGPATVYRTLNLLTRLGLALKREFGGGRARFEHSTPHHHDHLICVRCGQIFEFENQRIEVLQEKICDRHRFQLLDHKMELYGYCRSCRKQRRSDA